ncbi:hypothetical protein O181_003203 [Austropuccinia psidii MF-1]|uniref:Uncharacterized protein n=1 Tax=Austropuccinia psidii MF-1 TaxID=1389203 RepID=A0A9Q3BE01_9BASI|nr:hypothetical protein [Austropuccinia psidii MF-1]
MSNPNHPPCFNSQIELAWPPVMQYHPYDNNEDTRNTPPTQNLTFPAIITLPRGRSGSYQKSYLSFSLRQINLTHSRTENQIPTHFLNKNTTGISPELPLLQSEKEQINNGQRNTKFKLDL